MDSDPASPRLQSESSSSLSSSTADHDHHAPVKGSFLTMVSSFAVASKKGFSMDDEDDEDQDVVAELPSPPGQTQSSAPCSMAAAGRTQSAPIALKSTAAAPLSPKPPNALGAAFIRHYQPGRTSRPAPVAAGPPKATHTVRAASCCLGSRSSGADAQLLYR
jgi:hypothetical protein